jgi:hypothetical protein
VINQLSLIVAGFCILSGALLFIAYAAFIRVPVKSVFSILSCALLVTALCAIEIGHWNYFQGGPRPLDTPYYRAALFVVPSAFYFFGRWAILPTEPFRPRLLIHAAPILLRSRCRSCSPVARVIRCGSRTWCTACVTGANSSASSSCISR